MPLADRGRRALRGPIVLLGSFGHSNFGDDVLHHVFVGALRRFASELWCNAADVSLVPRSIREEPWVRIFPTHSRWWSTIRVLLHAELIVFGGGSILKELNRTTGRWKFGTLARIAGIVALSRLVGKRLLAFGIGVGPLNTWFGRRAAAWILRRMELVVVRDSNSYKLARSLLGTDHPATLVQGVDASFMGSWPQREGVAESPSLKHLASLKKEGALLIGLNALHDVGDNVDPDSVARALGRTITALLDKMPDAKVVLLPFQTAFNPHHDALYMERDVVARLDLQHREACVVLPDLTVSIVLEILRSLDLVVAMRLHALIGCVLAGIPFVALLYDEKCRSFVADIEYPYALDLERFCEDSGLLLQMVDEVLAKADTIRADLAACSERLLRMGQEMLELLEDRLSVPLKP